MHMFYALLGRVISICRQQGNNLQWSHWNPIPGKILAFDIVTRLGCKEKQELKTVDESDEATPLGLTFFKVLIMLNIFVFYLQRSIFFCHWEIKR